MTLTVNQNATGLLELAGTLDIDAANTLREALLQSLLSHPEVTVGLTAVDGCDTAALQVLLAARKDASALGKAFRFAGVSSPVADTAAALGVSMEGVGAR